MNWKFDDTPTRVHFALPAQPYTDLDGEGEFNFKMGESYFVKGGGPNHKGAYIEVNNKEDVVDAYSNPQRWGLDIDPITRFSKVRKSIYYAVAGWIEEWFHLVEEPSKSDPSKKYPSRKRCTGKGCKYCKVGDPKVFGKKIYTSIAPTHWESIYAANKDVNSACRCGGFAFVEDYKCSNCNHPLVDMCNTCEGCGSNNVGIDPDNAQAVCQDCDSAWSVLEKDNPEITSMVNSDMRCQNCDNEDIPIPSHACTQCDSPDLYGVFDCQLTLRKTGTGKQSDLVVESWKIQEPDARLFDPQYQGPDAEKAAGVAEGNSKPLDLNAIFAVESAEVQAQLCHVPNPFSSKNPSQGGFQKFSRHEQEDGDEGGDEDAAPEEEEHDSRPVPSKVQSRGRPSFTRRGR